MTEAAGKLSQNRRGALIVLDMGSDLRPEDFLYPGIPIDAQLSTFPVKDNQIKDEEDK